MEGKVNRRDFLKLLGIGGLSLGLTNFDLNLDTQHEVSFKKKEDLKNSEQDQQKHEYIDKIKKYFDIDLIDSLSHNPTGEKSVPQTLRTIKAVYEALFSLPPYLILGNSKPTKLYLFTIERSGEVNGILSSSFGNGVVKIELSSKYSPDLENSGVQKELYNNQVGFLKALIIHEHSHSMTESYPSLLDDWSTQNGWVKNPDGNWANYYLEEIVAEANANLYPWEDFATSMSVMTINPNYLANLSPRRVRFFTEHPLFQNWQVVLDYKKSHPDL